MVTPPQTLPKCPTGIAGLDEITDGGLPRGRPTLVCGGPGCGKTLFALEFIVHGVLEYDDPGVFMSFEESAADLTQNITSLGIDLHDLVDKGKLILDFVRVERNEIEETGEYDLEGLFIRLGHAIDTIGARRVVLDTIESLFAGLSDEAVLRAELRRLFRWLKEKGVTAIITGERGEASLTRQGLEEYVSDCVILLDHRVNSQMSTRRLRIVKYRGSTHGTNEYPFFIDRDGINVLPITSLLLNHRISNDRISSGIARLDTMLGGQGFYRGSSILVSGTAGTGKSSLAAQFVESASRRGETCLYFAFEESRDQVVRNMRSIGIDLQPWLDRGNLHFLAARPTTYGLEMHLAIMHRQIVRLNPDVVVIDPVSSFLAAGTPEDVKAMLTRLIDLLKTRQITTLCTNLIYGNASSEATECSVSSVMDTWLLLRGIESGGERNRGLYVLKSRGMPHSNQIREFVLSNHGIELLDVYLGADGVLTGSDRVRQEAREQEAEAERQQEVERRRIHIQRKRKAIEAQIALLQADLEAEEAEFNSEAANDQRRRRQRVENSQQMAQSRQADTGDKGDEG